MTQHLTRPTTAKRGPYWLRRLINRHRFRSSQTGTVTVDIEPDVSRFIAGMERARHAAAVTRAAFDAIGEGLAEAEAVAAYEERIRRERYAGRMHVLGLADDAWARYGWVRPKVAVRR